MLICCQQPRWQMEQFSLSLLLSWYIYLNWKTTLAFCNSFWWELQRLVLTNWNDLHYDHWKSINCNSVCFFGDFNGYVFFKTTYAFPLIYILATRSVRLQCRLCMHCHPPLLICSSLSSNHIIATDSLAAAAAHSQRLHPKEEWAK